MVRIKLNSRHAPRPFREEVELTGDTDEVPSDLDVIQITGEITSNDAAVARLLRLLNEDRQWESISICDDDSTTHRSARYLSVLGLAMLSSKRLHLNVSKPDEALCRGIMSGLQSPRGQVKKFGICLDYRSNSRDEEAHIRLIAEGLATSFRLEEFHFACRPTDLDARVIILDGLKRNSKGPKLLHIQVEMMSPKALEKLADYVGDEKCPLHSLTLIEAFCAGGRSSSFPFQSGLARNERLRNLCCAGHYLMNNSNLGQLRGLFPRLKKLEITGNYKAPIEDLTPLDPFLLGESATLETLKLISSNIESPTIMQFASSQLPKTKVLRELDLYYNPLENSRRAVTELLQGALKCTSLEKLRFGSGRNRQPRHPLENAALSCLHLNRFRNRMKSAKSSNIETYLWPMILQKCLSMSLEDKVGCYDDSVPEEEPPDIKERKARADLVFRVLQDNAPIFDAISKSMQTTP